MRRYRRYGNDVDASIAFLWFANEPDRSGADKLLESDSTLLAPDLMAVEATNAW
jgi:predicted nucleic acid-binding protein